ncbi:MAG TPA: DNA-formamidopyrimidine glycosylase family protein [Frankiaceae bacterium]
MPEGDTVYLAAKRMRAALAGAVLLRSDFRVPALATADLRGRTVRTVVPRGKHMLTRVTPAPGDPDDSGLTLHTHFRMEGSWRLQRAGSRLQGAPDWQVRVLLGTADWDAYGLRLPVVDLLPTSRENTAVGHLGPDLLDPDVDLAVAVHNIAAHPDTEVGTALLDQRLLAGLGNLYRCEACFLHGVSPWLPVGSTPDLKGLVALAARLMDAFKDRWEQPTTGDPRPGHDHWVFERAGRPCRRCGTTIQEYDQGTPPTDRITYWCPRCQAGPMPTPAAVADRRARLRERDRRRAAVGVRFRGRPTQP